MNIAFNYGPSSLGENGIEKGVNILSYFFFDKDKGPKYSHL